MATTGAGLQIQDNPGATVIFLRDVVKRDLSTLAQNGWVRKYFFNTGLGNATDGT